MKATVSGSFHRHMVAIYEAVGDLRACGVDVLSPSDPRVVDCLGEFLFVASDRLRSIRLVQDRHLAAIRSSDFLWVVCPDGYTGASTSMEIGSALAARVPVFSASPAIDITIGEYVRQVSGVEEAIVLTRGRPNTDVALPNVLIDPDAVVNGAHDALSALLPALTGQAGDRSRAAEGELRRTRQTLKTAFDLS